MKKNRGAISLFALLAMMFFLIFIMIAYNNVSSKGKTQVETTGVLIEAYNPSETANTVYNQLDGGILDTNTTTGKTTEEKDVINNTLATNEYVYVNGKIYKK
jgi:uncharacterized protein (UPF0333 family)